MAEGDSPAVSRRWLAWLVGGTTGAGSVSAVVGWRAGVPGGVVLAAAVLVTAIVAMTLVLLAREAREAAKWVLSDDDRTRRAKTLIEPFCGTGATKGVEVRVDSPAYVRERWRRRLGK